MQWTKKQNICCKLLIFNKYNISIFTYTYRHRGQVTMTAIENDQQQLEKDQKTGFGEAKLLKEL